MKKLMIMSAFALMASASLTNTQIQAKKGGYIWKDSAGCYYEVVTHSMLWGLIEWEDEPRLIGCCPGFA
ncbi:hypothetical protein SAMN05421846_105148 [Chryseobacterium taeanense]|uniref:Uncharacterized protein n=2 Tax=Chryseobacterium taeanense TaxID=311334 RepID=A0A1G8IY02_9FLAO|nr:hypothetical protein SAMN05421846_105148 [Chryseobacterium taeanense]